MGLVKEHPVGDLLLPIFEAVGHTLNGYRASLKKFKRKVLTVSIPSAYIAVMLPYIDCPRCKGKAKIPNDVYVGQTMRRLRIQKGLSVRFCARALKISAAYLSDLELGRRHFHEKLLVNYGNLITILRKK